MACRWSSRLFRCVMRVRISRHSPSRLARRRCRAAETDSTAPRPPACRPFGSDSLILVGESHEPHAVQLRNSPLLGVVAQPQPVSPPQLARLPLPRGPQGPAGLHGASRNDNGRTAGTTMSVRSDLPQARLSQHSLQRRARCPSDLGLVCNAPECAAEHRGLLPAQ